MINAGKTRRNEDQSRAGTFFVPKEGPDPSTPSPEPMEEAGVYYNFRDNKENIDHPTKIVQDEKPLDQRSTSDGGSREDSGRFRDSVVDPSFSPTHETRPHRLTSGSSYSDVSSEFDLLVSSQLSQPSFSSGVGGTPYMSVVKHITVLAEGF